MRTIAVINQKGGVGKTTTTANLGAALARAGYRVLLIDMDPQTHLTLNLMSDPPADAPTTYELLTESDSINNLALHVRENLWLIPSHIDLAAAEMELVNMVGREKKLAMSLGPAKRAYDFVMLDCPPSLGLLTINALTATQEVLIPMQPHFLALQGVGRLLETAALVRQRLNPELEIKGIILCMYDTGTRLAGEVKDDLFGFLKQARGTDVPWANARLFSTVIRRNIKLAECPSYGKCIFDYEPNCNGAVDYALLARELLSSYYSPLPDDPPSSQPQPEGEESKPSVSGPVATPTSTEASNIV